MEINFNFLMFYIYFNLHLIEKVTFLNLHLNEKFKFHAFEKCSLC